MNFLLFSPENKKNFKNEIHILIQMIFGLGKKWNFKAEIQTISGVSCEFRHIFITMNHNLPHEISLHSAQGLKLSMSIALDIVHMLHA